MSNSFSSKLYSIYNMKLRSASPGELRDIAEKIENEWTLGAPTEDVELDDEKYHMLTDRIVRRTEGEGESSSLFNDIDRERTQDGGQFLENFQIDISVLWTLVYEHRRYEAARGFTDAEMQVLRAVEFHDADRVGVDEIMDSDHAKDFTESTIYKALRTLRDDEDGKGLIERVRPGVYRYIGP